MSVTDLPFDSRTGTPFYELDEPLEKLQVMLNKKNIDVETLDTRSGSNYASFIGYEPRELKLITSYVDSNPEQTINSGSVRDLNELFDKDLKTNNPNYIFRDDQITRNNINTIRQGNQSFAKERDLFVVPPPINAQQQIIDLLKKKI